MIIADDSWIGSDMDCVDDFWVVRDAIFIKDFWINSWISALTIPCVSRRTDYLANFGATSKPVFANDSVSLANQFSLMILCHQRTSFLWRFRVTSDPVFANDFLREQRPSFVDESYIRNDLTITMISSMI